MSHHLPHMLRKAMRTMMYQHGFGVSPHEAAEANVAVRRKNSANVKAGAVR